ncbi:unnamed protein product, partial [Vitis vinifera]|uniref:Uncharacterized protein n=1 Tax=Vitis vinifera TaxID=29760 RepID=D7TH33_VITVI
MWPLFRTLTGFSFCFYKTRVI